MIKKNSNVEPFPITRMYNSGFETIMRGDYGMSHLRGQVIIQLGLRAHGPAGRNQPKPTL